MKKRLLAMLLAVVMVCSLLPVSALAAPGDHGWNPGQDQDNNWYTQEGVETSTISFVIENGTWDESILDGNDEATLSEDGTTVTFTIYKYSNSIGYVYLCSMQGGTLEAMLESLVNSSTSDYVIPDPGYTISNPVWGIESGGVTGSTASASEQMSTVLANHHDYDTHGTPTGGFEAGTVYILRLTKSAYTVTGTIDNGTVSLTKNSEDPTGGTTNTVTDEACEYADEVTLTFAVESGYTIVSSTRTNSSGTVENIKLAQQSDGTYTYTETVTTDITIKVTTEMVETDVTLSYNANGGTGTVASQTGSVSVETTTASFTVASGEDLAYSGYTFTGWNTKADGTGDSYSVGSTIEISEDTTLYAVWTATENAVTLSYDANGGTGTVASQSGSVSVVKTTASFTVASGEDLTYSGYTFTGWNTKADGTGDSYSVGSTITISEDTTLYAVWTATENAVTLSYDANGGTGTVASQSGSVSVEKTTASFTVASGEELSREGYTFTGWNTKADGTGDSYSVGSTITISEDTTLYAVWTATENAVTLSYDANGGTGTVASQSGSVSVEKTTASFTVASGEDLTYSGYTFTGWNTKADGTGDSYSVGSTIEISEDTTLYAVWTQNTYSVYVYGRVTDSTGNVISTTSTTVYGLPTLVYNTTGEWFTIGEVSDAMTVAPGSIADVSLPDDGTYSNKIDGWISSISLFTDNSTALASFNWTKLIEWTDLKTASGANDYVESGDTWHLDGQLTAYTLDVEYYLEDTSESSLLTGETTNVSGGSYDVDSVYILDGGSWAAIEQDATADNSVTYTYNGYPASITVGGVKYIIDAAASENIEGTGISKDTTVKLVYTKDTVGGTDDDPGDGIPDKYQVEVYYVAEDNGSIAEGCMIYEVLTIKDKDDNFLTTGDVKATGSTAEPDTGYIFTGWTETKSDGATGISDASLNSNPLEGFNIVGATGGDVYTYTASFEAKSYTLDVTKTLISVGETEIEYDEDGNAINIPVAEVDDEIVWTITVTNNGNVAQTISLTDTMDGVTLYDVDEKVVDDLTDISIAAYETITYTAKYEVVKADIGTTLANGVTATGEDGGSDYDPSEPVPVEKKSLSVTKEVNSTTAEVGDTLTYTITVANTGNVPLSGVTVTDNFGGNGTISNVTIDDTAASYTLSNGDYVFTIGNLAVGASAEIKYTYTVLAADAGSTISNSAVAKTDDPDVPEAEDDSDPVDVEEVKKSGISVIKTVSDSNPEVDQRVTYTITVKNTGDTKLENIEVTDTLPSLKYISVISYDGGDYSNGTITWTIDELDVGSDAVEFTVVVRILDAAEGVKLTNIAVAEAGGETTDTGKVVIDVEEEDDDDDDDDGVALSITKTVSGTGANEDDEFELEIYVENTAKKTYSYTYKVGSTTKTKYVTFDKNCEATLTIEAGATIKINGFDYGSKYSVEEVDPGEYTVTYSNESGKLKSSTTKVSINNYLSATANLNTEDHYSYIIGYTDGTVQPEGNLTRAEAATIFFRLLTDEARETYWSQTNPYSDVNSDDWYNNAISTLYNMGIISGYTDGTFQPNEPITRAELTKIAVSFFTYAGSYSYHGEYTDIDGTEWYADFVAAATELGLINGYTDGTFQPENYITRAETCAIVNRTLGRNPDADHLLAKSVMNTWPDNSTTAWYYADIQEATNSHDYEWIVDDGETVEDWTAKLTDRDWAALEKSWSTAYSAPGGEVMG